MQGATSLMHASEIKMLLNLPLIILVLTIKIFRNVKTLIMLMLFYSRPVASLKIFFEPKI